MPAVRQLLIGQLIEVVDGAAWDADIRQRRASRIDLARAIPRPNSASSTSCWSVGRIRSRGVPIAGRTNGCASHARTNGQPN
jgi:hypothetical protein